jgi:hypothetical protein
MGYGPSGNNVLLEHHGSAAQEAAEDGKEAIAPQAARTLESSPAAARSRSSQVCRIE